jgi:hypothetical protein
MNPNEYNGLVFDMPAERIPVRLAQETLRLGAITLWMYQAFVHHEHPSCGSRTDPERVETDLLAEWRRILEERFPQIPFVVEIRPTEQMTWYQASKGAPTEDEGDWQTYQAPVSFTLDRNMLKSLLTDLATAAKSEEALSEFQEEHKRGFSAMTPRKGSAGTCEKCNVGTEFSEPELSAIHRGIRTIVCANCGEKLIHSTKMIRELVNSQALQS